MKSSLLNSASIGSLVLAGVFFSAPVFAQSSGPSDVEQVTVTGSRIETSGFQTPTPVTAISPLQYSVKELSDINDLVEDIPTLTPNQNLSSVVSPGQATFNLRNVGSVRTLTMVDGMRTEATGIDQNFDINTLPAGLVQRIDIVTGGASAGYGSDAVSGIVNVVLNTTLDGFRGNFGAGESYYGDDGTLNASVAYGTSFDGGRGHFVLGGDYDRSNGVLTQSERPWGRQSWGVDTNAACTSITTTCTNLYLTTGVVSGSTSNGGVITAGPLKGIQFGPGGTIEPFVYGKYPGTYMIGGDGSDDNANSNLAPTLGRANFLGHVTYDLSSDVSVWAEMRYAQGSSFVDILPAVYAGNITITNQNAFIPSALATLMATDKVTSFSMGRSNVDLAPLDNGHDQVHGNTSSYDPSFGIKGKFDAVGTTWSWDLNGQLSDHRYEDQVGQNLRTDLFALSVDSLPNPAVGGVAGVPVGTPICRSTLANPSNGCVPVDLFGEGAPSQAATNYFMGTNFVVAHMEMQDVSANLKGTPFRTWAGPVSIATGAEYRRQSIHTYTDAYSPSFDWSQDNNTPYSGAYSVEEGYLEADVPLLKDVPLVELIDVDSAVRLTSYETSGGVTTWKVGTNWSVTDDIRIRGVRSHDIRAPNLAELFQLPLLRCCGSVTNPVTGVGNSAASFQTSGNPKLVPEVGDTISGGIVYTPEWWKDFDISVDYWNIKLTKQIVAPSAQQVVNNCLSLNLTSYCQYITYVPGSSQIASTSEPYVNGASESTDGVDIEASYRFDLSDLMQNWGGTVELHALGTYLNAFNTNQFGTILDMAGTTGTAALPRFKGNLTVIYVNGPWTASLNGNYIGDGSYNDLYNNPTYSYAVGGRTINNNNVGSRFYLGLTAAYQWTDTWQTYLRLSNAINTAPPPVPDTRPFQSAEGSSQLFNTTGGQITAGVKISLN